MKTILALVVISMVIFSCENEKDKYLILQGQIMEMNGPDTAFINELINIEIVFNGGTDGCAQPNHLEIVQTDSILNIKAFYSYPNFPTICPQNVPVHRLTYNFTPTTPAHYIFVADDGLNIQDTIVVTVKPIFP